MSGKYRFKTAKKGRGTAALRPALFLILAVLPLLFALTSFTASRKQFVPSFKRDDFNRRHDWWQYHRDGSAAGDAQAIVNGKGYLRIRLKNPVSDKECNVGISDFQNIYGKRFSYLSMEARVRLLTPMQPGSRGWGFWKSRKKAKSHTLAWFMQQKDPQEPKLSWSMVGTIAGKQRRVTVWPVDTAWHVYRIERDLALRRTRYWIDDSLVLETPGLAPGERLSFHLWIDNQVYSRRGVKRTGWSGSSALVADYVQISTQRHFPASAPEQMHWPVALYRAFNRIVHGKGTYSVGTFPFRTIGDTVRVILTARAENLMPFVNPVCLRAFLDGREVKALAFDGRRDRGTDESRVAVVPLHAGGHTLKLTGQSTPLLYDVLIVDGPGKMVLNKGRREWDEKTFFWHTAVSKPGKAILYAAVRADEADGQEGELDLRLQGTALSGGRHFTFRGREQFGDTRTIVRELELKTGRLEIHAKRQGHAHFERLFLFLAEGSEK